MTLWYWYRRKILVQYYWFFFQMFLVEYFIHCPCSLSFVKHAKSLNIPAHHHEDTSNDPLPHGHSTQTAKQWCQIRSWRSSSHFYVYRGRWTVGSLPSDIFIESPFLSWLKVVVETSGFVTKYSAAKPLVWCNVLLFSVFTIMHMHSLTRTSIYVILYYPLWHTNIGFSQGMPYLSASIIYDMKDRPPRKQ